MNLAQADWKQIGKAVWREYGRDDVSGLAAEMAYHIIFALFPFVIFLAALTAFVGSLIGTEQLFEQIINGLYGALPQSTADALRGPLDDVLGQERGGVLSISALLALWAASNGIATVMKAFNRAYGVEETRNFVVRRLMAMGLTVVLSLLVITGFVLLLLGGFIQEWIASALGLGARFGVVWTIIRIVGVVLGISLALAILYWKTPNVRQQFQWITPGSVLTTVIWILATLGFGLYVRYMGASSYSKTYGAAFGLILFLLYLYVSSTVVLLGAELNAEAAKRYDPELIKDKLRDPRKQVPGKQPEPDPRAAAEAGVSPRDIVATNVTSAQKLAAGDRGPEAAALASRASTQTSDAEPSDERQAA
ncbi:MAG: YihY/virulence factor BrkB family protein [Chloroflexi bacterium]|nr:YihY/virulence factor BrkB family protein [Chloroflexota bacterium]